MKAVALLSILASLVTTTFEVKAQTSGAQSLTIGPSIRASGTGRSSAAVFWGGDPDYWANPALLGYHDGLRFDHGKTRLVPDLADDVYFLTDRFTFGRWGIGIAATSSPFGRNRLNYGESIATDDTGNSLGTFTSYEEYGYFGVGASLARTVESLLRRANPSFPELSRHGDVALGIVHKDVHVDLVPSWATPDGTPGVGDVTVQDFGVLLRFTPVNSINGRSLVPVLDEAFAPLGGIRFDLAYGHSEQNFTEELIEYGELDQTDPVAASIRNAVGVHAAMGFPPGVEEQLSDSGRAWLARALTPLISFGWSRETIDEQWYDQEPIRNRGAELVLAHVVHLRWGQIEDVEGDIVDSTSGWGLGFELDNLAGFRYDRATVPQARRLDHVDRSGFTLVLHPVEIYRELTKPREARRGSRRP